MLGTLLALSACEPVKLEDFPRPFACDHTGGDGGVQCAKNWSCGFDDRCFPRNLVDDGGFRIAEWECENETHCPTGWQCGVEVDGVRQCQQLGVGAPSPCALTDGGAGGADAGGCQGGWRCGADQKCFDPANSTGGALRDCTLDEQCPARFRCGERVKDRQRCIELGVNAPSSCVTDRGCEGTYRCDRFAQTCVEVPDAIAIGRTDTLGTVELSPRSREEAPLFFAMTRLSAVTAPIPGLTPQPEEGVLSAFLSGDGGLRVRAQFSNRQDSDAGAVLLWEKSFLLRGDVRDVAELAVASGGPAVRYRDGGAGRLRLSDGVWEDAPVRIDLLRQRDSFDPRGTSELVLVSGDRVSVDGQPFVSFGASVNEVIAEREGFYVFTDGGSFFQQPDGGRRTISQRVGGPIIFDAPSRGATAGFVQQPTNPRALALFADLPRPGGGRGVITVSDRDVEWIVSPVLAGCPDGGSPLQLAIGRDDEGNREELISRCAAFPPPASFPVEVTFRQNFTDFRGQVEDQTPFQWGVVAQRAGAFVRAHAGAGGRAWYANDPDGRALLANEKLHPQLLDRQPEAMISFFDQETQSIRVFTQAGGDIFSHDPFGGFVSELRPPPISPLAAISSRSWIIGTNALLATQGGAPRAIATIAGGALFAPPTTGVTLQLQVGGTTRDVVLIASGDSIWFADLTEALSGPFAQPAVLNRVLVPVPGVPLRSMALEPSPPGSLQGYFTTSTGNFRFGTTDLVRWSQTAVPAPTMSALPLEV